MATSNPRSVKKISRPARNVNLVVCAMRNLADENGCTVGNIIGYLSDCCKNPAPKRQVVAALKRGIEFGILDRKRGRYFLAENEKQRLGRTSKFEDDNSAISVSARGRGDRHSGSGGGGGGVGGSSGGDCAGGGSGSGSGEGSSNGGIGKTASLELIERDIRTRKSGKSKKERKSKDGGRRKKTNKKSSGRKSMKKTRFSRSLKSYKLSNYYQNPSYRTSAVSSVDSLEYYEGED